MTVITRPKTHDGYRKRIDNITRRTPLVSNVRDFFLYIYIKMVSYCSR